MIFLKGSKSMRLSPLANPSPSLRLFLQIYQRRSDPEFMVEPIVKKSIGFFEGIRRNQTRGYSKPSSD